MDIHKFEFVQIQFKRTGEPVPPCGGCGRPGSRVLDPEDAAARADRGVWARRTWSSGPWTPRSIGLFQPSDATTILRSGV